MDRSQLACGLFISAPSVAGVAAKQNRVRERKARAGRARLEMELDWPAAFAQSRAGCPRSGPGIRKRMDPDDGEKGFFIIQFTGAGREARCRFLESRHWLFQPQSDPPFQWRDWA